MGEANSNSSATSTHFMNTYLTITAESAPLDIASYQILWCWEQVLLMMLLIVFDDDDDDDDDI